MSAAFTPGPWSASVGNLIRVSAASHTALKSGDWKHPVCVAGVHRIGRLTGRERDGEAIANAKLIAAAPELFDALFRLFSVACLLAFENDEGKPPILKDGSFDGALNAARAVLAKARGEA